MMTEPNGVLTMTERICIGEYSYREYLGIGWETKKMDKLTDSKEKFYVTIEKREAVKTGAYDKMKETDRIIDIEIIY